MTTSSYSVSYPEPSLNVYRVVNKTLKRNLRNTKKGLLHTLFFSRAQNHILLFVIQSIIAKAVKCTLCYGNITLSRNFYYSELICLINNHTEGIGVLKMCVGKRQRCKSYNIPTFKILQRQYF